MSQLAASAEPRTQPWQQDELCSVGRLRCAYTFDAAGRLTVRLPGGRTATVAALRERGHVVVLPRRIRGWGGA